MTKNDVFGKSTVWIALLVTAVEFLVFKYYYPYASFFPDSYTYVDAAVYHDLISFRPIGYSLFLSLLHLIKPSDFLLVLVQFLLMRMACLRLFFVIVRYCQPSRQVQFILFFFLLLEPSTLYICNYVSSDALFISLSLIWLTLLIDIVHRPSAWRLLVSCILLAMIFEIRYSALYYPLVGALAFLLSRTNFSFKMAGILGGFLVVGLEIGVTRQLTKKETGTEVFSAFGAWQIANNALDMYTFLPADSAELPTPECRQLDSVVRAWIRSDGPLVHHDPPTPTTSYMWDTDGPLKTYLALRRQQTKQLYFYAWHSVAPTFSTYGSYLIKRHPLAFCRYYIWPSAKNFFLPPLETLRSYNEGKSGIEFIARSFFHYPSNDVKMRAAPVQAKILWIIPWLFLVSNFLFPIMGVSLFFVPGIRQSHEELFRTFLLIGGYYILNMGFSIFATGNMLRYQLLPLLVQISLILCIIPFLLRRRWTA